MTLGLRIHRDLEMPMRDGAVLRADVWRLDDDEPRPALLMRTPYNKARTPLHSDAFPPQICAEAGYACVLQDVRGRFASDGEWSMSNEADATDAYDSVEWIAAQSWCDGNVGMFGTSAGGSNAWVGAEQQPP